MPSPREKGRPTRPRGSEEEFVLFLQGIPARCRWQELKDLVRQTALHIRQAVVYDDHHGFPTGLGQIIVKNEDEAWRTYHRLSTNGWEGQSLVVTLARTSSPTRPIAGPTKSPPCVIPSSYAAGYSTPPRVTQNMAMPPSPISPEPVVSTSPTYHGPEYVPVMPPMAIPHQPFMPIFTDPLSQPVPGMPNSPALRSSFCDPMAFGILPTYSMSHLHHAFPDCSMTNTIRMNPRRANNIIHSSTIPRKILYSHQHFLPSSNALPSYLNPPFRQPARRTVFVQNLSPQTTRQDLHNFLQETGTVEQCEVPMDPETTRCKGFARVTFHSAEEAKRAVALHNSTIFKGSKIRVKIDKGSHTASYSLVPGPYPAPAPIPSPGINADLAPALSALSINNGTDQIQLQAPKTTPQMQRTAPAAASGSTTTATPPTPPSETSDPEKQKKEQACQDHCPAPKPVDRCQPLVVNGSGIGRRAAVAT